MSEQLDLLEGLPVPPAEGTLEAAVARARAFVDRHRRICVDCGEDERALVFLHRDRRPQWHRFIARLVQVGASDRQLKMEIAKCEVVCRACSARRTRPYMLRSSTVVVIGVVAKGSIARCWGRKTFHGGRAKARGIVEGKRSRRVA